MITVAKDELAMAVLELGRLHLENTVESILFNGSSMVLTAGDPRKGTWRTRTIPASGPIPRFQSWTTSYRRLGRTLKKISGSTVVLDCDRETPALMDADGAIHDWQAKPGGFGPIGSRCAPVVALPWATLAKQVKKSTFQGLSSGLLSGSRHLQLVGTKKTVELVASNFTNRTVRALVQARHAGETPFRINLTEDAVQWLSRTREGRVVVGGNESLVSLSIENQGRESASILLQKPTEAIPVCKAMMVPRTHWGPGCQVHVRELKRAMAQLMAPMGEGVSGTLEVTVEPGRLSLAGSFSNGLFRSKAWIPCEASFSASARFDASALAPALRSVWTRRLALHWAGRQRLVLRSKSLIQYVNALA